MSRSMMTGLSAILGGGLGGGGGISGVNTLRTGGSDYANVTDSATLQFSAAMTISAYVNIDTTGGKQTIISKDDGGSDGYELYYDTTAGKFKGHIYISGAIKEVESSITPLAGVWYNVALWHDGTNLKLYIDGVQSGVTPASGSMDTNTAVFRIGASSTTIATNVFSGSIALVMGWNDDLTPAELTEIVTPKDPSLYSQQASMKIGLPLNSGAENPATDTSGNSNDAVLINNADYTGVKLAIEQASGGGGGGLLPSDLQSLQLWVEGDTGYSDKSSNAYTVTNQGSTNTSTLNGLNVFSFNGSNQYIDIGTQLGKPANFTVIAVVKPNDITSRRHFISGHSTGGGGTTIWGNFFLSQTSRPSGSLQCNHSTNSNATNTHNTDNLLSASTWHIIATRFTSGVAEQDIWVDGIAATTSTTGSGTLNAGTIYSYSIGRLGNNSSDTFDGDIAEYVVSDAAESEADILGVISGLQSKYGL